jgi:hypothetical protein
MFIRKNHPRLVLAGLGLLLLLLVPGIALAGLQRVEAVGSYGIRDNLRSKVIPRDEAVQAALWEGVSRVAMEALGEFSSAEEDVAELRTALGKDMLPYTRRFRVLDDMGEMPVLFAEDPRITVEYVLVVEVLVDVDRVKSALTSAGLLLEPGLTTRGDPVLVELQGIDRYAAFEAVLTALRSQLGATRIETLGFARARQFLSVEGPFGPEELSAGLARLDAGDLILEPIGIDLAGRRIRIRGIDARGSRIAPEMPGISGAADRGAPTRPRTQ